MTGPAELGNDPVQTRWVRLARDGDEDAFAALVRAHADRLYAIALRLTGQPEDAQDVVQDALLQAWQRLPDFREQARFSTWVTRILINRCHNQRRAIRPTSPMPDDAPRALPAAPAAEAEAVSAARRDAVREAVLSLPFDSRAPLVLVTFGGHTHAEVGQVLGISETAAKVRVHRARRALLQRLQEWR